MAAASIVRAALATVEAADSAATLADLPIQLLPALMNLVGADCAMWTELDSTAEPDQAVPGRFVGYPDPVLTDDLAMALEMHAGDFPLTQHTRPGGDGRPIRRSDLLSMRRFHDTGMYADVARKIGVDQMLALAVPPPGCLHVCISLNRAGRDFTDANVDIISQVRPLLTRRVAALHALQASQAVPAQRAAQLTERQHQVIRLVAEGLTDAAIARRLDCSPRTVDKHLEHIYRKLGVSSRIAAIATCGEWAEARSGLVP